MYSKNKDVYPTAKKKKGLDEKSLEEIICFASSGLNTHSRAVLRYLISLAKDGSLEQHQTSGNITKLADEILQKLREGNSSANRSS